MPYSVLIVGAGRIGALYDLPSDIDVLSHAHAFSGHDSFSLIGFVDPDIHQAELAVKRWGGAAYRSIKQAFQEQKGHAIDVVCITSPDKTHINVLSELLEYPLNLAFCEKPLATEITEANDIIDRYVKAEIPLAVNYSRRYVPAFQALASKISEGRYGQFVYGAGYYGNGLLCNGSHLIDLITMLVGYPEPVSITEKIDDGQFQDASFDVILKTPSESLVSLKSIDSRHYTLFELDLFFSEARIRILDNGFKIETHTIQEHPLNSAYQTVRSASTLQTEMKTHMAYAADNIAQFLGGHSPLKCTAQQALGALQVCHRTQELYLQSSGQK